MPERNPEAAQSSALKLETDSEVKAESLYERLEEKVGLLHDLRLTLDTMTIDMPPEQVEHELDDWIDAHLEKLPAAARASRIRDINDRVEGLLQEAIKAPFDDPGQADRDQEVKVLQQERAVLFLDQDVMFAVRLEGVVEDMIAKNRYIHSQPATLFMNDLMRKKNLDFFPTHEVVRTDVGPFSVNFTLTDEGFSRFEADKEVGGLHFRNSPFSIIRHFTDRDTNSIARHEDLHNMLDASSVKNVDQGTVLQTDFQRIQKKESGPDEVEQLWERITTMTSDTLLDTLHEETLTGLESAEQSDFGFRWTNPEENMDLFGQYAQAFSTAGTYALNIEKAFDLMSQAGVDAIIQAKAEALAVEFRQKYVAMVDHIRYGLELGFSLGGEPGEAHVHSLLFILPPSKYRHLERYIMNKYGEKKNELESSKMGKTEAKNEPEKTE